MRALLGTGTGRRSSGTRSPWLDETAIEGGSRRRHHRTRRVYHPFTPRTSPAVSPVPDQRVVEHRMVAGNHRDLLLRTRGVKLERQSPATYVRELGWPSPALAPHRGD